mmetsp:Transcript_92521/g.285648  ORF Transcript_92521/g.285648 Transcript_92521/m.285648 type:complete len:237 (-) Transcript_92521:15-725(-)
MFCTRMETATDEEKGVLVVVAGASEMTVGLAEDVVRREGFACVGEACGACVVRGAGWVVVMVVVVPVVVVLVVRVTVVVSVVVVVRVEVVVSVSVAVVVRVMVVVVVVVVVVVACGTRAITVMMLAEMKQTPKVTPMQQERRGAKIALTIDRISGSSVSSGGWYGLSALNGRVSTGWIGRSCPSGVPLRPTLRMLSSLNGLFARVGSLLHVLHGDPIPVSCRRRVCLLPKGAWTPP